MARQTTAERSLHQMLCTTPISVKIATDTAYSAVGHPFSSGPKSIAITAGTTISPTAPPIIISDEFLFDRTYPASNNEQYVLFSMERCAGGSTSDNLGGWETVRGVPWLRVRNIGVYIGPLSSDPVNVETCEDRGREKKHRARALEKGGTNTTQCLRASRSEGRKGGYTPAVLLPPICEYPRFRFPSQVCIGKNGNARSRSIVAV